MKPLLFAAAALLLIPAAAQAQVAAGTVPNTFDRPAAQTPAPRPAPTPAAPAPEVSQTPANANSQATLRTIIEGAKAGTVDYSLMSDDLANKVREQESAMTSLIQSFGDIQGISFMGSQSGADMYAVTFAGAATQWVIGFNESGKVAALLFRPAE